VRIVDSTDTMLLTGARSGWFYVDDLAFGDAADRGFFMPNLHWSHMPANVPPERMPDSNL